MPWNTIKNIIPVSLRRAIATIARSLGRFLKQTKNSLTPLHPSPVIIFGNQKTGSTAIAALLAQATDQTITQDIFYSLSQPWHLWMLENQKSFDQFVSQNPAKFSTAIIKEPSLIFYYPKLLQTFPKAKFVFLLRDPRDNIRSILNRLSLPGNLTHLTPELQENIPNYLWRIILDGQPLGIEGNTYIEKLAYRWNRILEIYRQNQQNITLLRYEDFLADKQTAIKQPT